jgi:hypothetical protein
MDTPQEETQKDRLAASTEDEDPKEVDPEAPHEAAKPAPAAERPKGSGPAEEDSYEDGWYQVLKRRADGSGEDDAEA